MWREDDGFPCLCLSHPPGGVNGGLADPKEWLTELHYWEGEARRITAGGGAKKKKRGWNNPVVRAPRKSVQSQGEGAGYPACRQNGTREGAAAFLLAVQEPERPRNILRERRRPGAPIPRLCSWPRGGNLPRPHSEVLQLQWNAPGFWPWPLADVVWRKSQRDGPQGERRVQQARWEHTPRSRLPRGQTAASSSSWLGGSQHPKKKKKKSPKRRRNWYFSHYFDIFHNNQIKSTKINELAGCQVTLMGWWKSFHTSVPNIAVFNS